MKPIRQLTAVLIVAVNLKGEVLITKRQDPGKVGIHNKWQFPGGKLEYGETPEQALVRECREELGVGCLILFPYPIVVVNNFDDEYPDHRRQITLLSYIVTLDSGELVLDKENAEPIWIKPDAIVDYDFLPNVDDICLATAKILKTYPVLTLS